MSCHGDIPLKRFLIGIQARSNNTRLPRKAFEMIGRKRLLDHVIHACLSAEKYSNKFENKHGFTVKTAVLVPKGDPIKEHFRQSATMFEGSEKDVLDRYYQAAIHFDADWVVRVTGDCPLIPGYIVSKMIKIAAMNSYDYLSNVEERLSLDGIDCEVISRKMIDWLKENATAPFHREHVTVLAREAKPEWAKFGAIQGFFDLSNIKLSVDTPEDLEAVRKQYDSIKGKIRILESRHGENSIHRL